MSIMGFFPKNRNLHREVQLNARVAPTVVSGRLRLCDKAYPNDCRGAQHGR
jgi:hypothetical protein